MKKFLLVLGMAAFLGLAAGCSKENAQQSDTEQAGGEQGETSRLVNLENVKADIGEYKGLEVQVTKIADVTDEDVQMQLESTVNSTAAEVIVTDRVVSDGDLVSIDYQGYENNEPFGEAETNYYVTIGSGVFFDGAEQQLIGKMGGDVVDIPVSLPEAYPDEAMAGKDVVFKVTVNGVVEAGEAELTDEYVSSISDCKTVEEYKARLKEQMQESVEYQRQMAVQEAVWNKLLEQTKIEELPEEVINQKVEQYKAFDKEGADLESMSVEDYVETFFGMSEDEYNKMVEDLAMEEIKTQVIVKIISEKEGFDDIEVTDEEMEKYAKEQGYEDVETFKKEVNADDLKQSILLEKVTSLLVESAKVEEVDM